MYTTFQQDIHEADRPLVMPRYRRDDNMKVGFTHNAYGSLARDGTQAYEEQSIKSSGSINFREVLLLNDVVVYII
jgi:hypothetical protein